MQNQNTFRSNQSNKYVTPRKNTVKKKKINLHVRDFEQSTADSYNFNKQWKITDFEIIKQMGRGKFGFVYAAKQKQTDYVLAIKKMSKIQLKQNDFQQQVKRQIIIQASLNHHNILKLFGYFWDHQYVYLILQYAPGGQLFNLLQKNRRLPEDQVSIIIRQVCQGVLYLHENNIIHRDIKPQNILISGNNVKIGDFGWSIHSQTKRQTLCGTLDYLAPEIVKGETHDHTIDVWQIGILAYQLSTGHPPFQTCSNQLTYERIIKQQVLFPTYVSYELRQFVRKILQKNPNKRMNCSQILKQPFVLKYLTAQPKFNDIHK